jgi:hypothetical protein
MCDVLLLFSSVCWFPLLFLGLTRTRNVLTFPVYATRDTMQAAR